MHDLKDFTPARAASWVDQEFPKYKTKQAVAAFAAEVDTRLAKIAASGKPAPFPNAILAKNLLLAKLKAKFKI